MNQADTEATLRFLFDQPLIHVMVIGLIFIVVLLLAVVVMLIRLAARQGAQDTQVQTHNLEITAALVGVTGKLTDRVEALVNKAGMTAEQVAALSLIIASVNDSFGRFRSGMAKWVKSDYTTKRRLAREMQEVRTQCSLLNQMVNRMDGAHRPEKFIRIPEKEQRK